jgi:hypothetical protein
VRPRHGPQQQGSNQRSSSPHQAAFHSNSTSSSLGLALKRWRCSSRRRLVLLFLRQVQLLLQRWQLQQQAS